MKLDQDMCLLDSSITKQMERIKFCVNACIGIPNETLAFSKYNELLEKEERYDLLLDNVDALFETIDKLLKVTGHYPTTYEIVKVRDEAMKVLSELRD